MALESGGIDEAAAEAAVARAQAAMKEDHGAEEVAAIQASLQKALAQLHVKRRRHYLQTGRGLRVSAVSSPHRVALPRDSPELIPARSGFPRARRASSIWKRQKRSD